MEDISARIVVDASGRRCLLASQLGIKHSDPAFRQFGIYSWYEGLQPPPEGTDGLLWLHFLGLERAWAWTIPLRNGVWSIGFVTDKDDYMKSGTSAEEWATSLIGRNANLAHSLSTATRIRPWKAEGDYTYRVDYVAGQGWLLVGDALRFVDPVLLGDVCSRGYCEGDEW